VLPADPRSPSAAKERAYEGPMLPPARWPWEVRFTREEIAESLRRGACLCGIEEAQRHPRSNRDLVPTSPNCEAHRGR
jgi:hypothetical protein